MECWLPCYYYFVFPHCTLVLTFFYSRFKEGEGTVRQARVKQNYGMIFSLKQDTHSNSVRITYFPTHILLFFGTLYEV